MIGERTEAALRALMPGGVTALLPNPGRRFPLACPDDPETLGLRVVSVPELRGVRVAVLQSSANLAGGRDARRVADVPGVIRSGADLVIDGGVLPGRSSTVVDLRGLESTGDWAIVREGAVSREQLAAVLDHLDDDHFDPATYATMIRAEIADYETLQSELISACEGEIGGPAGVRSILELGVGTGETSARLLERFPEARLTGVDISAAMLIRARTALPAARAGLQVGRLQDALPEGSFDLVASALCIHHLGASEKADLFERVLERLAPGGRFVIADVVVPDDAGAAVIELSPGYDRPDAAADQVRWLREAGFASARLVWSRADLAVIVADAPA